MTTPPQAVALTPPNGGNCTTRGPDTPTTRPLKASCNAKPPPPPARRAPEGPEGLAAVPVGGGVWPRCWSAAAGPDRASSRRAEPHVSDTAPLVWRAPEGPEGLAAVPVGGGGAWPGFETTRRAVGSRRGRRAGGPPPTGTQSSPAQTDRAAPGTPAGQQATQRAPAHAETPSRRCGTGFSLPSRV